MPVNMRNQTNTSKRQAHKPRNAINQDPVSLLNLPEAALEMILGHLDATTLASVAATCRAFSVKEHVDATAAHGQHQQHPNAIQARNQAAALDASRRGQSLYPDGKLIVSKPELAAMQSIYRHCWQHVTMAARWRQESILMGLLIEEAACGFDVQHALSNGFVLYKAQRPREEWGTENGFPRVELSIMGPRLLVSDISTAQRKVLRWQLAVSGNNAVEFGVVPVAVQDQATALHKCLDTASCSAVGVSSHITAGSALSFRVPIVRGSLVELVVIHNRLLVYVINPVAKELFWVNNEAKHRLYTGPREFRLEVPLPPGEPVKLALTAWARASFDVFHCIEQTSAWQ